MQCVLYLCQRLGWVILSCLFFKAMLILYEFFFTLFHLHYCSVVLASLYISMCRSFYTCLYSVTFIGSYSPVIFSIYHSGSLFSISGHLLRFHLLAITKSTTVNILQYLQILFLSVASFGHTPSSRLSGAKVIRILVTRFA